jgi:glycine/D-amino acid oxidase-like deaminating enzyme/nitrite reductase/ring-hydroxylating ferredoxin subunit
MNANTVSYWNQTGEKPHYPRLDRSLETDVVIIGGGITGVTCAYCLAEKGVKPVLIEAGGLCDGTTGNTTGKVTSQHGVTYYKLENKYGPDAARAYARSQQEALDFVRSVVAREGIQCQLTDSTAYIYGVNDSEMDTLEKEYEAALKAGIDAALIGGGDFPPGCRGLLAFRGQLVFHPVRYTAGLASAAVNKGAAIYCSTKAVKLENGDIKTIRLENDLDIRARHVIMATQYPFYDGPNLFYTRLYPKRTYGIAVKAKRDWPDGSYINVGTPSRSIRTHAENGQRILIVVGDSHDTGRYGYDKEHNREEMATHYENLMQFAQQVAGVENVLAMWSAQDYDTPDELPYIGPVSEGGRIYAAAGFRKWGLSTGTLAGRLLTELITQGHSRDEKLYAITRSDMISSPGKAFVGAVNPVIELIKSKLEGTEPLKGLKRGEGRVIRFEGQKAGIYRGDDDRVTILDITCTHMGTELNFNDAEKTWDCPAHGGRFNTDGKLLEGPPKDNLKVLLQGKYEDLTGEEQETKP